MNADTFANVCMHHSGFDEALKGIRGELKGVRADVRNVRNLLITFLSTSAALTAIATAIVVALRAYL